MLIRVVVGGSFYTNCYIVGDEESLEAILIDPGAQVGEALELIESLKLRVDRIINTHAHIDHVCGVERAKRALGAKFYLHRDELPVLEDIPNAVWRFPEFRGTVVPEVDGFLEEGDEVTVGRYTARVLHVPGHTPGSICLVFDGHVFDGDTLFAGSIGRTDLTGGSSMEELVGSIKTKLLTLPGHYRVYSGHGPVTTIDIEKRTNPFLRGGLILF
ncbi:MAG: MBL fold metallo-hydrolase [Candidatus Methanosuratincola sp.]|jgi:glyoxylase-like metal-dependent hydrolase (beta-lactamase superfamily II)